MDILATIRSGCASSEVLHKLKKRCRDTVNMNGVLATKVWGILRGRAEEAGPH